MTDIPTNTVTSVTREEWIARAKNDRDFCDLTSDEQNQLARAFGQTIDPNLSVVGRIEWATVIQRRLQEVWPMPGEAPEVGFTTIMDLHADTRGRT